MMNPRSFLLSLAVAGVFGCTGTTVEDSGPADEADNCRVPEDSEALFGEASYQPSPNISTFYRVGWSPTSSGQSWLRYIDSEGRSSDIAARERDDGGVEVDLLALRASETYDTRLILETEDEILCSEIRPIETGALPANLPIFTHETFDSERLAGGFSLIPANDDGNDDSYIVILDPESIPVWYYPLGTVRPRLSMDGRSIFAIDFGRDPTSGGVIRSISLDGSSEGVIEADGIHMDFVEVEPGTFASFGWDVREFEEGSRQIAGETIVEFTAEGDYREVWSLYDDFEPDLSREYQRDLVCCPEIESWAHFNHLHYSAEEDAYYLTTRYLLTVHKIDRQTGTLLWTLSNSGSRTTGDFVPEDGESVAFSPHSAVPTEQGVLVFDTGSELTGDCSAYSEFLLDSEQGAVEHGGFYATEDCLVSYHMGNATELWNGNRTLVLATSGQIDETTSDGELLRRQNLSQGFWVGFASQISTLYPETEIRESPSGSR